MLVNDFIRVYVGPLEEGDVYITLSPHKSVFRELLYLFTYPLVHPIRTISNQTGLFDFQSAVAGTFSLACGLLLFI